MSIVYFDLETDSVAPDCQIIQLAAVAVDAGYMEIETFEHKVLFDVEKADPKALEINHYDAKVWQEHGVHEKQAVQEFSEFLNRHRSIQMTSKRTGKPYSVARLAGHNAASFDGPRIQAMFKRHDAFLPAHPQVLCSLQRALWYAVETGTHFESLKLESLCKHFGIELSGAHDALADVRGSVSLSLALRGGTW